MMNVLHITLFKNDILLDTVHSKMRTIKNKIYNLGNRVFNYLIQNQYPLAVSIGSYVVIQIGITTASAVNINFLEICQKQFCNHLDKLPPYISPEIQSRCPPSPLKHPRLPPYFRECMNHLYDRVISKGEPVVSTTFSSVSEKEAPFLEMCQKEFCTHVNESLPYISPEIQSRCNPFFPNYSPFSSYKGCMDRLYDYVISKKEPLTKTMPLDSYWNAICPINITHWSRKKLNAYMASCFNKLCSEKDLNKVHMDERLHDCCSYKRINKFKKVIKGLSRKLTRCRSNNWKINDLMSMLMDSYAHLVEHTQSMLGSMVTIENSKISESILDNLDLIKKSFRDIAPVPLKKVKKLIYTENAKLDLSLRLRKSVLKVFENMFNGNNNLSITENSILEN